MARNPDFRGNPRRAVFVQGFIGPALVERLTPVILELQDSSRDPITVYIDSQGGSVRSGRQINKLLVSTDQDSRSPCRIITVVTGLAGSASADLLSSGDYAIAYPDAVIFHHGGRESMETPISAEDGHQLIERLKSLNSQSAMSLAYQNESRFMFIFVSCFPQFRVIREEQPDTVLSDLDCFLRFVRQKVSAAARALLLRARKRHDRCEELVNRFFAGRKSSDSSIAEIEAGILRTLIDLELESHNEERGWSFAGDGIGRLNENFLLLKEYVDSFDSRRFAKACERWGGFVLTADEKKQIEDLPDVNAQNDKLLEIVRPRFFPIWSFFVSLCHALQQGEQNWLTALDGYWLGLVDEVIGEDLLTLRAIVESQDVADEETKDSEFRGQP